MAHLELGWLAPCLSVSDLAASLEFYQQLDSVLAGGGPAQGYLVLQQRNCELHLHPQAAFTALTWFAGKLRRPCSVLRVAVLRQWYRTGAY